VADALVLDVPMELGLELMAIVGPHLADPEGEAGNDVVDEGDRIGLGVPVIDLEGPDAGRIINRSVLVALDRLAVLSPKDQELDVDLDLVAGDLLLIALGMDLANPGAARKPVQAVAPENAIYAGIGDLDVVIARQISDDPNGSQVVSPPQMKNLLDNLRRRPVSRIPRHGLAICQARFPMALQDCFPAIKAPTGDAEMPAGLSRARILAASG